MEAFLPVEWNFGDRNSDGIGGEAVSDGGIIYVWDNDEESDNYESLILKTSFR